jgi:hypothetical protein
VFDDIISFGLFVSIAESYGGGDVSQESEWFELVEAHIGGRRVPTAVHTAPCSQP